MASGLATACPACGTVFRVVPDQLRVSEGWVRCGRCNEVFNAAEALIDLDTGQPRQLVPEVPPVAALPPPSPPPSPPRPPPQPPSPPEALPAAWAPPPPSLREAELPGEPELEPRPLPEPASAVSTDPRFAADAEALAADAPTPTPSFVRRAQQAERWRRPRVRLALAAAAAVAALLLAAQAAVEYRDHLAARAPALRPALVALCAQLGCSVGAPRAIEQLSVESSGLVRVEKSSVYRLQVALRNRAATELALPALDLSLTDAQGKLVVRRVLRSTELGLPATQATIAAGRDIVLQATLQTASADPVAGYTIELFYP